MLGRSRYAVVVSLAAFATAGLAAEFKATHHVHGSWVNLRAAPGTAAPVVRQLELNTPVQLFPDAPANGFCRVLTAERQEGFMQCGLLGEKPYTEADLGEPFTPDGQPNPKYSPARAFWLRPSVDTLLAAGLHFEQTMLSKERRDSDQAALKASPLKSVVRRFKVPEFEAMKAKLFAGVVSRSSRLDEPKSWNAETIRSFTFGDPLDSLLAQGAIQFPSVSASYFKTARDLLLAPGKGLGRATGRGEATEGASYAFDVPYRAAMSGRGPVWVPDGRYYDGRQFGAWDMAEVETELLRPIHEHTLHADWRITSRLTTVKQANRAPQDADDEYCPAGEFGHGDANPSLYRQYWKRGGSPTDDSTRPRQQRLFSFYTAGPLPTARGRAIGTNVKLPPPPDGKGLVSTTSWHFDVDGDGVADLMALEGVMRGEEEIWRPQGDYPDYRAFFANIGGQWFFLGQDWFLWGCGC